jgi:hypothetical protein
MSALGALANIRMRIFATALAAYRRQIDALSPVMTAAAASPWLIGQAWSRVLANAMRWSKKKFDRLLPNVTAT